MPCRALKLNRVRLKLVRSKVGMKTMPFGALKPELQCQARDLLSGEGGFDDRREWSRAGLCPAPRWDCVPGPFAAAKELVPRTPARLRRAFRFQPPKKVKKRLTRNFGMP